MRTIRVLKPIEQYAPQARTEIPKTNFQYGLINYGTKIFASTTGTSSAERILYTVPSGKIFYLISAQASVTWVTALTTGTAGISAYIDKNIATSHVLRILISRDATTDPFYSDSVSVSFSIPLKLIAGESIRANTGVTALNGSLAISGYEIDASLVPNFQ